MIRPTAVVAPVVRGTAINLMPGSVTVQEESGGRFVRKDGTPV